MRILDRYIIRNFLINYVLAFVVLVGMVILLDLILNFDRFIKGAKMAGEIGTLPLLADIGDFYFYQLLVIFQVIAGVIPLLAAGFTMVRMTRHRELIAMLASGMSLYRVAALIILLAIGFSLLSVIDQELLIPRFQDKLLRKHDEVNRAAAPKERFEMLRDKQNLVTFSSYDRRSRQFTDVRIIWRDDHGVVVRREMADKMTWRPDDEKAPSGKWSWWMEGNTRYIDDRAAMQQVVGAPVLAGGSGVTGAFQYTTGLEPRHVELFLSKRAVDFLSSPQIMELIKESPAATRSGLEKIMHTRFTQPLMNMVMLLLGIPFLLTREPSRLIRNLFTCTAVSGTCFASTFVFFQMGGTVVSPLLGAWLPVLVFGPIALAMLDTIQT